MYKTRSFFMGVVVSLAIVFSLLMLSGAVVKQTPNYYPSMRGQSNYPAIHVACSSDGRTVYIADEERVMRSKDFGDDWVIVMTSMKSESSQR
jgi:hypothetical protein